MEETTLVVTVGLLFALVVGVILAIVVLTLGVAIILSWRRRRIGRLPAATPQLGVDVRKLPAEGPPEEGPQLLFYGTPVRLAVLVLAPVGRNQTLPDKGAMPEVIEQLVPGLMDVLTAHRPIFRPWPEQISSEGFTNAFFAHMNLPGEAGKGTPWCAIAGKFRTIDQQYLAGLVCCGQRPNGLGQLVVKHDTQWPDILRIGR